MIQAKNKGSVKFIELSTVKDREGSLVALNRNGSIAVVDAKGREKEKYSVVYGAKIKVKDKQAWQKDKSLMAQISAIKKQYKTTRFYLRPSGTENVVRVLTESIAQATCNAANAAICQAIEKWNRAG